MIPASFRRVLPLAVASIACAATDALSQTLPAGWIAITDEGRMEEVRFETMPPGWHLWPGPAAVFYDPARSVDETFRVEFDAHGFASDRGAYGVFFGGPGAAAGSYDFFEVLVDGEGRFRLGHNAGPEYHEVIPWTRHEAIGVPTEGAPAFNELAVDVSPDRLAVTINGVEVTAFDPPEYARFSGGVGVRVLEGASAHVTRLEVQD